MPRGKSKASQGGLTSPKLYDSGADFRIEFAENTEGRQVRISCIFVAHHFCARVKSRIVSSLVYRCIPLHPLVAYRCMPLHTIVCRCIRYYISISIYKHINIYKYSNISMCLYKRSLMYPPPMENDPPSGK